MGTTYGASSGSGVIGQSASFVGVWAESDTDEAVHAETGDASNNYGLYTPDNIYSLNYHLAGALMQLVQNGGRNRLSPAIWRCSVAWPHPFRRADRRLSR